MWWTLDNIEDLVIWIYLFVICPIVGYLLYSLADVSIVIWLIASAFLAAIITFFLSPLMMILFVIIEFFAKLFWGIYSAFIGWHKDRKQNKTHRTEKEINSIQHLSKNPHYR